MFQSTWVRSLLVTGFSLSVALGIVGCGGVRVGQTPEEAAATPKPPPSQPPEPERDPKRPETVPIVTTDLEAPPPRDPDSSKSGKRPAGSETTR